MIRTHRTIPDGRLKLVVFDLDGTLIDSRTDLVNSVNAMLRHFQRHELSPELVSTYIGDGAPMLVRRALGDPDDDHIVKEALGFFIGYYREHKLDNTVLFAGIREALVALQNRAATFPLQLAVLTNKPVTPARQIVEALGLAATFARVYGGNSFVTKKPDPHGLERLMAELYANPDETVMIGDSCVDVFTGRNAGTWTLGVTFGFQPHSLEDAPPDVLVDSAEEMAHVLGG